MLKKFTILLAVMLVFFVGCGNKKTAINPDYQFEAPQKGDTIAVMKTSMGDITLKFFPKEAPLAVKNFLTHAKDGYYNGVTFHRVMKDFMIQGGDPQGTGSGGQSIWGKEFKNETSDNLHHFRGALAMANAGPDTNGSQFFIVQNETIGQNYLDQMKQSNIDTKVIDKYSKVGGVPSLDGGYTVFGQVIEGMDIVDKIASVEVLPDARGEMSVPKEKILINSIEVKEVK